MSDEKRKMTSEEAELLIDEWAEFWELDNERDLYKDVIEELRMPVKLEKLTFDVETEKFNLVLSKPVKGQDGPVSFVSIKSTTMEEKQILQRYGDDETIQAAVAMLSKYTNLSTNQVNMLYDKDTSRINAVISGFITQTDPKKKG